MVTLQAMVKYAISPQVKLVRTYPHRLRTSRRLMGAVIAIAFIPSIAGAVFEDKTTGSD